MVGVRKDVCHLKWGHIIATLNTYLLVDGLEKRTREQEKGKMTLIEEMTETLNKR